MSLGEELQDAGAAVVKSIVITGVTGLAVAGLVAFVAYQGKKKLKKVLAKSAPAARSSESIHGLGSGVDFDTDNIFTDGNMLSIQH